MTYLFLGEDLPSKDSKIAEFKKKLLTSKNALHFDYEVLYGHKLEAEALKKALITLPVVSKQRLLVIRDCEKLNTYNQKLILEFIRNPEPNCVLILDSNRSDLREGFIEKLRHTAKVLSFDQGKGVDVSDLKRAIAGHRGADALKILAHLFSQGEAPLRILGFLVWYWRRTRREIALNSFKEGLLALQNADLNIKRSRLKPEHAIELAVVQLCSCGAYAGR